MIAATRHPLTPTIRRYTTHIAKIKDLKMKIIVVGIMVFLVGCGNIDWQAGLRGFGQGMQQTGANMQNHNSYTNNSQRMNCNNQGSYTYCNNGTRTITCSQIGSYTYCN